MIASRAVPFFNYCALFAANESGYMAVIRDVLARGAYIMQSDLAAFEERLANYVGARHALGLADGTMAITFGLLGAGVGPGDEVLVPSHTFVATAAAVHHTGATPVLVDCSPDHLIDSESARRAVTARTKAILPVQLNGRTADMDAIGALARERGLKIVEDSCQALGSKFNGRCAGTFGVAGSFSFYPSKTLGCFGDGGALVTDDDTVAEMVRELRDHGRGRDGLVHRWGYNARLDNLQAAILNFKLDTYDRDIARRRRLAGIYQERLSRLHQLLLPPAPDSDPRHFDIFQNYEIEAERRDELARYLADHSIGTLLQWGGRTIHQFAALGVRGEVPYTEKMTQRYMMLPMNTSLSDDDVNYVCDRILAFYRG
jgi:dTDP-4-amino-4,6-dideoxygalactose transaminase